jgi:hypothetical protein
VSESEREKVGEGENEREGNRKREREKERWVDRAPETERVSERGGEEEEGERVCERDRITS